ILDAIAKHAARVVQARAADDDLTAALVIKAHDAALGDFVKAEPRRHITEAHRKARLAHLRRQRVFQALRTMKHELAARHVKRHEKGQPLQVIPVQVAVKHIELGALLFTHDALAKQPQARARIEDEVAATADDLDARSVAAKLDGVGTRGGNRTANTKER